MCFFLLSQVDSDVMSRPRLRRKKTKHGDKTFLFCCWINNNTRGGGLLLPKPSCVSCFYFLSAHSIHIPPQLKAAGEVGWEVVKGGRLVFLHFLPFYSSFLSLTFIRPPSLHLPHLSSPSLAFFNNIPPFLFTFPPSTRCAAGSSQDNNNAWLASTKKKNMINIFFFFSLHHFKKRFSKAKKKTFIFFSPPLQKKTSNMAASVNQNGLVSKPPIWIIFLFFHSPSPNII